MQPSQSSSSAMQQYEHKVSGHNEIFCLGNGQILKMASQREQLFYQRLLAMKECGRPPSTCQESASSSTVCEESSLQSMVNTFLRFVPRFFGAKKKLLSKTSTPTGSSANLHDVSSSSSSSSNTRERMQRRPSIKIFTQDEGIVLEDVCYPLQCPCILDLKMGSRQYGLDAPDYKVESKTRKAYASTSHSHGIRMAGLKCYYPEESTYRSIPKNQCRGFDADSFSYHLLQFFHHSVLLVKELCSQLQEMIDLFSQQNIFRFYTSSLLIVYDGAELRGVTQPEVNNGGPNAVENKESKTGSKFGVRLVMIDFAYTYTVEEVTKAMDIDGLKQSKDEGYLFGLLSLQRILKEFLQRKEGEEVQLVKDSCSASDGTESVGE